jgi:hypothetical protein
MSLHLWDYPPDALEVTVSELLIATAATSDNLIDDSVRELLHGLRENLGMDVIFLSEIRDGQRQFKHVDTKPGCEVIATGGGSSLEVVLPMRAGRQAAATGARRCHAPGVRQTAGHAISRGRAPQRAHRAG